MIRIVHPARALALVSLVALLATALAQGMTHVQMRGGATPPGAASSFGGMGFGMPMAGQIVDEADFLVHMIPHHREAVATSEALAAVTQRPELRAFLEGIASGQTAEIASMEAWLDRWYPDVDRDVAYAPMMRDLGPDAAVADVERAFLEDMIGHHMMAAHDAQTLLAGGLAEHEEVADLARSIVNTQMQEMQQMASWLRTWFGVNAPMGMGGFGMGGFGMGSTGMGGFNMGGYGDDGATGGFHPAMNGRAYSATIGAAEAERLALAFLAGRGEAADATQVAGTTIAFEVVVRVGDTEQVLRVDARTGQVTLVSER